MRKQLTITLDEKVYQRLLERFAGDENGLQEFAARILETQSLAPEKPAPTDETNKGLEDYLKKGSTGDRSYGIKGQGW